MAACGVGGTNVLVLVIVKGSGRDVKGLLRENGGGIRFRAPRARARNRIPALRRRRLAAEQRQHANAARPLVNRGGLTSRGPGGGAAAPPALPSRTGRRFLPWRPCDAAVSGVRPCARPPGLLRA